jgi:hypothetical protein
MPERIALFACPCCGGHASLRVPAGTRAPRSRACSNPACPPCIGSCRGKAARMSLMPVRDASALVAPVPQRLAWLARYA